MPIWGAVLVASATGIVAWLATGALIPLLRRSAVLDRPNERSLHANPTPRGGGAAPVGAILFAWLGLVLSGQAPAAVVAVLLGAPLLAAVSGLDDVRSLSPAIRLVAQCVAVALGITAVAASGLLFGGWLPSWLDAAMAALVWIWFVNLFNFMDGIDGIAGSEAAAIGVGLALVTALGGGHDPATGALALCVAAAALGFLLWNWAPAQVFLGDIGSVPLGYLLGFLLLQQAAHGHWRAAVILPLYFLADATITLLRRLLRGAPIWQAHREHFYQRTVQGGLGHAAVVRRVIAADLVLIGAAWFAENGWAAGGLVAAATAVAVLLGWMGQAARRAG